MLLSILVLNVSDYHVPNEPLRIIEKLGESPHPPSDEEFFDERIADYTFACGHNTRVNDYKASMLRVAVYCLLLGVALHACDFIVLTR